MGTALSMRPTPSVHGWSSASMLTLQYFTHWLFWRLVNVPGPCRGFREAWKKPQRVHKEKSWRGSGGQGQPGTVVPQWEPWRSEQKCSQHGPRNGTTNARLELPLFSLTTLQNVFRDSCHSTVMLSLMS